MIHDFKTRRHVYLIMDNPYHITSVETGNISFDTIISPHRYSVFNNDLRRVQCIKCVQVFKTTASSPSTAATCHKKVEGAARI